MTHHLSRRRLLQTTTGSFAAAALTRPALASAKTKIRFLTSWFAQAEHGGFYQALATGLYDRAGLDVTIAIGGPQVNGMQLLVGGAADMIMGYDIQVLKGIENGLPVTTIGTSFQFDLQGVMTHPDITGLAGLKGHQILIASASHSTFWPWLKQRYGFTDAQAGPDTFNLQPFLLNPSVAMQAYPSSEPFEAAKAGAKVNFFLFADDGYPPYGSTMVTTKNFLAANPAANRAFVKASLEGWKDYLVNPAPANALIKQANPQMADDQIAFAISRMQAMNVLGKGDAATQGIGTMTAARWKQTYDFLVAGNILSAGTDWRAAFTTQCTAGLRILPA
jgi:NitT/TauT family transport system substrate-binding protein